MRKTFTILFSLAIAGFIFMWFPAVCFAQTSGTNIPTNSGKNPKAPADAVVVYVTPTGAGLLDGSSWLSAYPGTDVQTAIDKMGITEVWIKKGTYKPTSGTDRAISFQMKIGVGIYGGFAGTETLLTERVNFGLGQVNETILSGDIGTENENTDNSYHLFYHSTYLDGSAVLDGFTIER